MRRRASIGAAALFLLTCFAPHGLLSARLDTSLFHEFGERVLDGRIPYRDFSLEYPPAAVPVFVLPALTPGSYASGFKALMAAAGAIAVAATALALVAVGARGRRLYGAAALAALLPIVLGPVSLIRYDLWPAALVAVGLACMVSGRERAGAGVWGVATAAKLYPLALAPLLAIRSRRSLLPFGLAALAVTLPFVVLGPGGLYSSLERQTGRGLHLESLGAAALLALHHLGLHSVSVEVRSGAFDVTGGAADALALVQTVLQLAAVVAAWLLFSRTARGPQELATATAATVAAFVTFGKVLSPQFLLWLVPLVPLVAGSWGFAACATLLVAAGLTHGLYPGQHEELVELQALPAWLLVLRNTCLVLLTGCLLLALRAAPRARPAAARGQCSGRTAVRSRSSSGAARAG